MTRLLGRFAATAMIALAPLQLAAQDTGIEIGSHAPPISLPSTQGATVNLADIIGKKPVVLEFWATWCENCKELEPRMMAAHTKYSAQVAFYGIAVPINQTLARVQRYVAQYKYPYPMLWDEKGDVAAAYDVAATSYVVVIDRAGKVVYTGVGGRQDLDVAIRKALVGTASPRGKSGLAPQ